MSEEEKIYGCEPQRCHTCQKSLSNSHVLKLTFGRGDILGNLEVVDYERRRFCSVECLARNFGYTPGLK